MLKLFYIGIVLLTFLSCKPVAVTKNTDDTETKTMVNTLKKDKNFELKSYFECNGTEPFWNISIAEDKIVFKTIGDSIVLPHVEPILAMDANVKMYRVKTATDQFNIQIVQQNCTNEMSGHKSPYTVSIEYKKNTATQFEKINGCGHYITDYRLHDIWVLEELNGKKIKKEDFSKSLPLIEIYASTNKFSGFSGCNQMNGTLFCENKKLRFMNVVTTEKMCEISNKEPEFITTLQSVNAYTIENNRLILSNTAGKQIKFKKID
ncbi:META domain-containing protein [Flavobacterium sp.]|uniref:META domain-containing protein n=1 Tax=Flavobacterium sp. TaxID=239 RepID=UPI003C5519D5